MATAKKPVKKIVKKTVKKAKKTPLKSFAIQKEQVPFMTFRVTDQTVYWSVLFILILILSLWVLNIQLNISDIINNIQ